jgi:hypothetical protein
MTAGPGTAVLSVADAASGRDHVVELAVRGLGDAGLADASCSGLLDRSLAKQLAGEADELGRCLSRTTLKEQRAAVGERLSAALLTGPVAALWTQSATAAAGRLLRVRLDIRPGPLRALPWELLRWGDDWAFTQPQLSIWRGPAPKAAGDHDAGPLRVLVVVCNPRDHRIRPDEEVALISGSLAKQVGKAFVEVLDGPDRTELSAAVGQLRPHVLHFIGHGMPRIGGNEPQLWFNWLLAGQDPATATSWSLSASQLGQLNDWQPRLVVINACRLANDLEDPAGGFADAFLAAGSRAVVSMQANVESPTALRFSELLYENLGHFPLDEVVARARRRLSQEKGDTGEWAMPVLAARTDPAEALGVAQAPAAPLAQVGVRPEYAQLRDFLDRSTERRDAWWALDPEPQQAPSRPVLVVRGAPVGGKPPGKTWFAHWCLLTYFLRGHRVTYVDLAVPLPRVGPGGAARPPARTKNWLDAVRIIRDACTAAGQLDPLPATAFSQFNASLNELVDGLQQARKAADLLGPVGAGPVTDENRPFNYDSGRFEERISHIWSGFLSALRQGSAGRRHIIALDGAESIIADDFPYVYEGLIRPVAQDLDPAVRVMLIGSDEWLGKQLPVADSPLWASVSLGGLDPDQFMRLARDYCYRVGLDIRPVQEIFDAYEGLYRRAGTGVPLNAFCQVRQTLPESVWAGQR